MIINNLTLVENTKFTHYSLTINNLRITKITRFISLNSKHLQMSINFASKVNTVSKDEQNKPSVPTFDETGIKINKFLAHSLLTRTWHEMSLGRFVLKRE